MIITVTNQKGGVAKTTTAVSLAHGLAIRTGLPVLLIDLDQQGHAATALGMRAESCVFDYLVAESPFHNCWRFTERADLYILPGNARTKHVDVIYRNEVGGFDKLCKRLRCNAGHFEHIVIDTPAEGLLQEAAIHVADWVVIPARCESLSVAGVRDTLALCRRLAPAAEAIVLPTLFDGRLNEHKYNLGVLGALGGGDTVSPPPSIPVAVPVPSRVAVAEATACGKTVWEWKEAADVCVAYTALLDDVLACEASTSSSSRTALQQVAISTLAALFLALWPLVAQAAPACPGGDWTPQGCHYVWRGLDCCWQPGRLAVCIAPLEVQP